MNKKINFQNISKASKALLFMYKYDNFEGNFKCGILAMAFIN